uniref:Interleukin-4 n=1 Tax=Coturnix japonica TaxID=93934 RepID=A0A8C2UD74_COTJA
MLAQLTVLLALGVLCSPAPTSTPLQCSTVYSIIEEVKSDMKNNRMTVADLSSIPMDVEDKTCMRNNLKTFMESLKANWTENRKAIFQLSIVHKCEHIFPNATSPQVPDKECRPAQVSRDKFMQEFTNFLNYLQSEGL